MTSTIPKKIVSLYRPTLISIGGSRYLVISGSDKQDGWYPVKENFDIRKIYKVWTPWGKQKENEVLAGAWTWQVQNSKKNGYYTVKFDKGGWSCDCTGFGYRRKCRHVDEAKTKMN